MSYTLILLKPLFKNSDTMVIELNIFLTFITHDDTTICNILNLYYFLLTLIIYFQII